MQLDSYRVPGQLGADGGIQTKKSTANIEHRHDFCANHRPFPDLVDHLITLNFYSTEPDASLDGRCQTAPPGGEIGKAL